MIFDCGWDSSVMAWTIAIGLLLLIIMVMLIKKFIQSLKEKKHWISVLHCVLIVFIVFIGSTSLIDSPRNISLTDSSLKINKLFSSIEIEYSSIKEIRRVVKDDLTGETRNNGSTGFGGDLGTWSSKKLGKYEKFTTNTENQIWLETIDGKNIMFSCNNPDQLVDKINKNLNK